MQQVREHLDETSSIDVEHAELVRQVNRQRDLPAGDERACGLDGAVDQSVSGTGCRCSWILPEVMREISSRSSMSRTMWPI